MFKPIIHLLIWWCIYSRAMTEWRRCPTLKSASACRLNREDGFDPEVVTYMLRVDSSSQKGGNTSSDVFMLHVMQYGRFWSLRKKVTIHQVTIMLAISKNALFPGHNHLLTTGTDDPSLAGARTIIKVSGHQYWWLAGGYDLEIGQF